jgi:hypothetical protein
VFRSLRFARGKVHAAVVGDILLTITVKLFIFNNKFKFMLIGIIHK